MPWIPKTLQDLPTVLAGPILRKVTNKEVSVWMILKSGGSLTLKIYDEAGNELQSETASTRKLGDHVHVACITAKSATPFLSTGETYGYNVFKGSQNFSTSGFLSSGLSTVTYFGQSFGTAGNLPSFILPGTQIEQLRVLHGSCRKPHGQGIDAMSTVSQTIAVSLDSEEPFYSRPQMLFLTGDQIYADDVADSLLYMIRHYSQMLFNWSESHPSANNTDWFNPGKRHNYIKGTMGFPAEDEDCKSHLMGFQEYILMYIMAWSPDLWDIEGNDVFFPEFSDVFPGVPSVVEEKDWLPHTTLKIIGDYEEVTLVPSDEFEAYEAENEKLYHFAMAIKDVRRAMANVPTYMIFDDHEVTDDWFLNYGWTSNALTAGSLQRRVIANGMSAYAICQGWGNTPEQFNTVDAPGFTLLSKYEEIANSYNSVNSSVWDIEIAEIVLPFLEVVNNSIKLKHYTNGLVGSLDYHWSYSWGDFEVIALDSRTRRAFTNQSMDRGKAYLLSNDAVLEQVKSITTPKKDVTILITGTPLYGSPTIEKSIEFVYWTSFKTAPDIDYESWNVIEYARHTLMSALASRAKPPTGSERAMHRVVCLSGDVHYGFTNRVIYNATKTFKYDLTDVDMVLIQCCASSFKNQTTPAGFIDEYTMQTTMSWHRYDPTKDKISKILNFYHQWGFNNENQNAAVKVTVSSNLLQTKVTTQKVKDKPFIIDTSDYPEKIAKHIAGVITLNYTQTIQLDETPDWEIQNIPIEAHDLPFDYDTYVINGVGADDYFAMSSKHKDNYFRGGKGGRYIVGYNQLGDLLFRWNDPQYGNLVDHRVWWRNIEKNGSFGNPFPLSIFVVSLDL